MTLGTLRPYEHFSGAAEVPVLVRLAANLYVAQYEVMKIVPAKFIIEEGLRGGSIDRSAGVADTTSGTFALGIGIVCTRYGLPFKVFSDPVLDPALKTRLELMGGSVEILTGGGAVSPQQARLAALKAYLLANPATYWLRQYDNPLVLQSYAASADRIRAALSRPISLVCTVGSGGSSCGLALRLREHDAQTRLIGVDTFGSVLFGLANGAKTLRGMGNSIMPENLKHDAFDEVHWVEANGAIAHSIELLSRHGLYCGQSTGAAYQVAKWLARRDPDRDVVFVGPDSGHRYQASLLDHAKDLPPLAPGAPQEVGRLAEVSVPWSMMAWRRRTLSMVRGA